MEGLCCEYAWALSRVIEKPMFCYFVDNGDAGILSVGHAFVKITDTIGMDVEGLKPIVEMKDAITDYEESQLKLLEVKHPHVFNTYGAGFAMGSSNIFYDILLKHKDELLLTIKGLI